MKRKELIEDGTKITYRCSSYRKYPKCDFQIKALSCNNSNAITVSTSSAHNHDQRALTTRAPSPVRRIVINAVAARLTQSQTRRAIEHEYGGQVSRTQISSLLNYHRSLLSSNVYSIDDLRSCCHQRCQIPDSITLHKPFVTKF